MASGTYAILDNKNLIGLFDQMYEGALNKLWSANVAMRIDSDRETEDYGWLGSAPTLAELTGEAKAEKGFKSYTYALKNVEYARAITIREKDLRRDKLSQLQARVGELAQKAAEHWDTLTSTAITTNGNAYDGVAFFAATHSESGTAQKNLLTASEYDKLNVSTATAPTVAEAADILPRVLGHFHTLTDDNGDPCNGNARSFTCVCGTVPIHAAISGALASVNITDSNGMRTNPVQGYIGDGYQVKCILTPRLSSVTDSFFLFVNDGAVKPFIHQEEVALDAQSTDTSSDEYIKFRRFLFSLYTSRAVGYGRWQSAIKATMS